MRGINQVLSRPIATSSAARPLPIEVRNQSPFAVGVVLWRDESDRLLATVVAKASYDLAPGTSELAATPDPIRHGDEHWDDRTPSSLRAPSDLVPFKAMHEVLVVGHAYANGNRPAHAATARLVVGAVDKLVEATTPCRSDRDGELERGAPQSRFSLRYEVAARGLENPIGIDATGFTPTGGHVLPQLRPANVEHRPGDYMPVMGFGPLSGSWHARDSLLRLVDREWLLDPARRPRPTGFDLRYFSTAPNDQRTSEPFHPDERLILEGLHPTHARLVTNLAGVAPALRSVGSRRELPPFVADTLWIDTDRQRATLTFRAIVALDDERLVLEVVPAGHVDTLGADATTELERSAVRAHLDPPPSGGEGTTELDRSAFNDTAGTVLPFAPSSEPGRPVASRQADGALPFQPPSERPAARSVPPPLPPLSPPPSRPQLVSTPPKETLRAPLPPPSSPSSAFGLSRLMPQPRPVVSPDLHEPEPAATTEPKNTFRKAFGVKAASDAAVALEGLTAATKAASDAAFAVRTGRPTADASSTSRRAIVDLIALEGGVPARLRRSKRYAPLLVAPAPPRAHKPVDAPVGEPSAEDRGRVDTLRVLSCGTPLGAEDLQAGFDALLDDAHDFDIPLFLVEGQVKPTMDELETLRVAVELAKPLAGSNKRVQAALALASDALARTTPPLPDSAIALYRQLEAATGELALPSRHLADLVDRTLLEARSYRKRTLLGEPRIRAELAQGRQVTPIYLPEAALSKLPLLPTFEIAALVELRPREDVSESSPVGLVAFALGRVLRTRS